MSDTVIKLVEQLTERVAALEAEIAKLRAPEVHYHYHYSTPSEPKVDPFQPFYPPNTGTPYPSPGYTTFCETTS